jgi:hypothetical protein
MKKIIAAAVAAAFVAPVYAADITVSGEVEMTYVSPSAGTDSATNADNIVTVTATDEIDGVTISASVVLDQDAVYDIDTDTDTNGAAPAVDTNDGGDGSHMSISANGVTLSLGDVAGGMDAVGDYTDISPAYGGFNLDGNDHSFALSLPAIAGLNITASMSPEAGFDGTSSDETGLGVSYSFPNGQVYFGTEDTATETHTAVGIRYSMNGIYVAYERGEDDNGAAADTEITGFAVSYRAGDIEVGMEKQEITPDGGAATEDETVVYVQYHMGPVDLYVAQLSDDADAAAEGTTVGIEYAF